MLLADVFNRYANEVSPTRRGERWEVIRLKKLARDDLAKLVIASITARDIAEWRDRRLQPERLSWSEGRMGRASDAVARARARGRTRARSRKRDPGWQDPTLAENTIDTTNDTTGSKGGRA